MTAMMDIQVKSFIAKVALFAIAAVAVSPYYTRPIDTSQTTFEAIVTESASFVFGVLPWLMSEPLRWVAVLPAVLIVLNYAIQPPRV